MTNIKIETDSLACNAMKEVRYTTAHARKAAPDPVRTTLAELVRLAEASRPLDDYRTCECTVCKMHRLALEVLRAPPQSVGNPLGSGKREAIARIIDPRAFTEEYRHYHPDRSTLEGYEAYKKADAILSLPEGEGLQAIDPLHSTSEGK